MADEITSMPLLKITTIEGEPSVILPPEMLTKLGVGAGDTLFAWETANGVELYASGSEVARQLEVAETVMDECRDTLRMLADNPIGRPVDRTAE